MSARVDLVVPPMAGHLHPVLGIAARLVREQDLEVRVLSTAAALPAIAGTGADAVELLAGADDVVAEVVDPPYRVGSNPRLLVRQLRATAALQVRLAEELREAWRGERPDLVLADFTMAAVGPTADAVGIPWWTTHPSPCAIEARSGPPSYVGGWRPGRGPLGRARDAAGRRFVRGFKSVAPRLAGARLDDVGLSSLYRVDGSEAIYSAERVLALVPGAIEYPRALPAAVRYVGPVLYTPSPSRRPLVLRPGCRHVLVTAGTHVAWHREALVGAASRAAAVLAARDVELHLSLGRAGASLPAGVSVPDGLAVHDVVDYTRDLGRFDAVVHHGGSGVLGHTLAAGLPSVVWPVDYDQPDHAARLVDAGVAVRLEHPERLAEAVVRVLEDPSCRDAAGAVARTIAARPALETITAAVRARLGV
ncbi:glycosyltransferase [Nocardioides zeae]|uniref:UDP:flavonoid glycosyltransferase YjiC (YdhE family) n=1 Tax=Nocardioides zeae TaxID=1457234 RepID=A0AAJ1TZL3_9ACTN|nr:nucleotide disphospho-sugar-binding domain-containing protein [Nocardioides zeae]MDQ1104729.1 UDP:flavonoid glycosyltransferase YjiC (YdhE family) [Nocardioides zeae]